MIAAIRSLPRTVWLLGLISLVNDSASDMIYPLVPLYLTSVLMAGPKALGLIEGVAEAASSLLKLAAGVLSDRTRTVTRWVIAGYAIAGIARPLIAFASSWPGAVWLSAFIARWTTSAPWSGRCSLRGCSHWGCRCATYCSPRSCRQ